LGLSLFLLVFNLLVDRTIQIGGLTRRCRIRRIRMPIHANWVDVGIFQLLLGVGFLLRDHADVIPADALLVLLPGAGWPVESPDPASGNPTGRRRVLGGGA